ncbi:MAG: TetR family transcriptional regulator [Proteobacteria bacterium]|nr:TetR family transcriptional regulator [Pseudomonadota bacterium]
MKTRSKYHHGELREVLLALAVQQVAAVGAEKLSMRELARQAGVSATAPFRHFPDKLTLLAALAIDGFTELAQRMQNPAQTKQGWEAQFVQLGSTYVQFAEDYPVHYQLMFGAVLGDFSKFPQLQEAASSAYSMLDKLLAAIKAEERLRTEVSVLGGLVWSTVHGMASLKLNVPPAKQSVDAAPRQAVKALTQDLHAPLRMLYRGILASG